jgi:hypothetical protein
MNNLLLFFKLVDQVKIRFFLINNILDFKDLKTKSQEVEEGIEIKTPNDKRASLLFSKCKSI